MNRWLASNKQIKKVEEEINKAYNFSDIIDPMYTKGFTDALMFLSKTMIPKKVWDKNRGGVDK